MVEGDAQVPCCDGVGHRRGDGDSIADGLVPVRWIEDNRANWPPGRPDLSSEAHAVGHLGLELNGSLISWGGGLEAQAAILETIGQPEVEPDICCGCHGSCVCRPGK